MAPPHEERSDSAQEMVDLVLRSLDFDALPHPFGGFSTAEGTPQGDPVPVNAHLLVSGPTSSGKSRRVLAPAALKHDGPVVMVSSKPDLIDLVAEGRLAAGGGGHTYVLDLGGSVRPERLLDGVEKIYLDPCVLISRDDQALDAATIMSSAANGESSSDPYWEKAVVPLIAAVLRAAGSDGISWASLAMPNTSVPKSPLAVLTSKLRSGVFGDPNDEEGFDVEAYEKELEEVETRTDSDLWGSGVTDVLPSFEPSVPSWFNAAARLQLMGSPRLSSYLRAQLFSEADRMTASLAGLAANAVSPWLREAILPPAGAPLLRPETMTHPRATLFVVAPPDGVAAPAAILALDMLASRWRDNQSESVRLPTLLFVIDEMMNTAPWAKLPTVVTESRSMGVNLVGAVQSTAQFARRFGVAGMDELRRIFPSILLLAGATEVELMSQLETRIETIERHNGVKLDLPRLPISKDEGLLIHSVPPTDDPSAYYKYQAGVPVGLKDVSSFGRELNPRPDSLLYDYSRPDDVAPDVPCLIRARMDALAPAEARRAKTGTSSGTLDLDELEGFDSDDGLESSSMQNEAKEETG